MVNITTLPSYMKENIRVIYIRNDGKCWERVGVINVRGPIGQESEATI